MHSIQFQDNSFLNVYNNGRYDIVLGDSGYYSCFPAIDGKPMYDANVRVVSEFNQITVCYILDEFTLELTCINKEGHLLLRPAISKLKVNHIEIISIFLKAQITGLQKLLAHGYFSWDQSFLYDAAQLEQAEANGLSVILSDKSSALAGYLTHDRFFQTFHFQTEKKQFYGSSDIYLEGKDLLGMKELQLTEIAFFSHTDLDLAQKKWAQLVVQANQFIPNDQRTSGWCSWYYDYFWFSGTILERHLEKFSRFKDDLQLNVFVIDANHFLHLGDWLYPDIKFQKGLKHYAAEIKQAGYIPGIWIGPWMVADRSFLFREHKDWLCHNEQGELIEFMSPLGEDNVWGYRSKMHYCLDTSHPDAIAYLRKVFRTYREWGFRYFKTDFMFWGSMDRFEGGWYHEGLNKHNLIADKSKRPLIKRYTPGKTRIEYFIDVMKMIREEIGPDSIWLGCGQPIWASIGLVDCMRISRDVGPRWEAHNSPKELLNDLSLRNFTNHRFYEVDPDCILLRTWETKINEQEATSLALFMGVAQGMIMTSDYIDECPDHRLDLFRFLLGDNHLIEFRPPLLGRETDLIIYSGTRKDNGLGVIFFFNNGEDAVSKTYHLSELDIDGSYAVKWKKEGQEKLYGTITIHLEAHESTLVYIQKEPFPEHWQPAKITG
jgi:alpha-galactosidase